MKIWVGLLLAVVIWSCSETASLSSIPKQDPTLPIDTIETSLIKDSILIDANEIAEVQKYFRKFIKKRRFNGQILVAKNGQIVFDTTNGYANIRRRIKLQDNSSMQLASVSKPITATVILQLIEEGKINLEDTITKFLPNLPEHYSRIIIKHLLAHRSGLAQYYYYCDNVIDDKEHLIYNDTVLCVMDFHNPGHYFPPGRKHNYCNTNYLLLASIIEAVENDRYHNVIQKRILSKCGMDDSFVFDLKDDSIPKNLVLGHTQWNKIFDFDYLDGIVGDKGIFSNASDLFKFDQALTNGLLLSDSIMDLAHSPHNKKRFNKSYGLGWRLKYHKKLGKIVYHTGWWHGNRHIYIRIPQNGYTIIILSNALRGSIYNMNNILDQFNYKEAIKYKKNNLIKPEA